MAMLRPAEEMKDSGIEWVGFVPQDWNVVPIGSCFDEVVKKNKEGLVKNALKFTYGQIVPKTNFDADEDDYVADTILNYYIVDPGTIMINGLNLNFDLISQRTALVKERGIITSAYVGIIPKDFSVTLPDFMNYLFKAYDYRMAFHNMGGGVRKILNFTRLKSQKVCFPTITEQQAIADYLDDRCSKLDEIITEAEKSIEEYKELKQAVIFEAVTKGLDKNVPMKDSGVEWIGKIPESSRFVKLKYLVTRPITDGTHQTPEYDNAIDGSPFLSSKDVTKGYIDWSKIKYITLKLHEKLQKEIAPKKDDILLAKNGTTGVAAIVDTDKVFDIYVTLAVIRPNKNAVIPKYLLHAINSYASKRQFDNHLIGIGVPNLHLNVINNTKVIVHSKETQKRIVDYLDASISQIDSLISEKQSLIEDLKAYKKSLIYEVVTGKRRVV